MSYSTLPSAIFQGWGFSPASTTCCSCTATCSTIPPGRKNPIHEIYNHFIFFFIVFVARAPSLKSSGKKALSGMGFYYCCCQRCNLFVTSELAVDRGCSPLDLWILYAVHYCVAMENAGFLFVDIGKDSSMVAKRPYIVFSAMSWPDEKVLKTEFTDAVLFLPVSIKVDGAAFPTATLKCPATRAHSLVPCWFWFFQFSWQ